MSARLPEPGDLHPALSAPAGVAASDPTADRARRDARAPGTPLASGRTQAGALARRHALPLKPGADVPGWWQTLFEQAPGACIFLSPAWIQSWLDVYGREFSGFWLHWEVAEEVVGGCLILERTVWQRRLPLRTLFLNGSGQTTQRSPPVEFNQILHRAGYEELIASDLARWLSGRRWTRMELSGHQDSALTRCLFVKLPACAVDRSEQPAPYVDLLGIGSGDYEATLTRKTRAQIRRCRRMYEESDGPVRVAAAANSEQAIAYLGELAILHNATWKARGSAGVFANEAFRSFHRLLILRLWPSRSVDVLRVRAGQRVIGYIYNFLHRGKVYCFQSGFIQEQDPHLKPGMLSHAAAIRYYRERGCREYDFLAGDMRYKRSLAKSTRTLVWSVAWRRSAYGRLLQFAKSIRRGARALCSTPGDAVAPLESGAPTEPSVDLMSGSRAGCRSKRSAIEPAAGAPAGA